MALIQNFSKGSNIDFDGQVTDSNNNTIRAFTVGTPIYSGVGGANGQQYIIGCKSNSNIRLESQYGSSYIWNGIKNDGTVTAITSGTTSATEPANIDVTDYEIIFIGFFSGATYTQTVTVTA